jgi:hypothetical protein
MVRRRVEIRLGAVNVFDLNFRDDVDSHGNDFSPGNPEHCQWQTLVVERTDEYLVHESCIMIILL